MQNKINIIFLILFFVPCILLSQKTVIVKPDGSMQPFNYDEVLPVQKAKLIDKPLERIQHPAFPGTEGLIDTVYERDLWPSIDSRFGWYGQDVMIQFFKAPSDLILKSVGFGEARDDGGSYATQVEVKVVEVLWTESQILDAVTGSAKHLGYYEAPGNGYNDAVPLRDDFDGINSWSDWHVVDSTYAMTEPFGNDIWSDNGLGAVVAVDPANANAASDDPTRHFVDMNLLGYEPTIQRDQTFAVAIKNSNATVDDYVVRTWSTNLAPHGAFKYYANGRLNPGVDYGWWARLYDWDFFYVADIISGPLPPQIFVTNVRTTLSIEPQIVVATIYNAPPIDSVYLMYSTDNMFNWDSTAMVNSGGDTYISDIPGQIPGTVINYYIKAIDTNGYSFESQKYQYRIFQPSGAPTLLVFNGFDNESGYPQDYYFGKGDTVNFQPLNFAHDVWAFGPLTMELLDHYNNVLEITTTGPDHINSDTIATWLAGSGDRNYMLAGDEWLGAQSGWPLSQQHFPGEFIYDILGIEWEYNDIVNSGADINRVIPVDGSLLGDSLHYLAGINGTDSILYDPNYELTQINWLDGVGFLADVEVDLQGVSLRPDNPGIFPIAGHRTLAAGNKIAFLAYDPLSLNADPYFWYGFSSAAPQVQVLRWFGADTVTAIDTGEQVPQKFSLSQNYPNPFNPLTTIEYKIARAGKVQLTVYDMLGREVAKLVNEFNKPGKYSVQFDGSKFASGLYLYKLTTADKTLVRKMLLIK